MESITQYIPVWTLVLIVVAFLWDIVWKMIALWRSARNGDLVWFVLLMILNTVGILPIIYLLIHRKLKD